MKRREFTRDQKDQIVERATDAAGTIRCEGCGLALKKGAYEIDHIIAEQLRPAADKKAKLTIAEGQLLGACCHRGEDGKTAKDVKQIAKAKRQSAKDKGITAPSKPIQGKPFARSPKPKHDRPTLPPRSLYAPVGQLWEQPSLERKDRYGD